MKPNFPYLSIPEDQKSPFVKGLLEFIEHQGSLIQQQAELIQQLKDEIARLKSQPPKPKIQPRLLENKLKNKQKSRKAKRAGSQKKLRWYPKNGQCVKL